MIAKKEYDIYGNLILEINIGRPEFEIGSYWYEFYKEALPYVINSSKNTALFTDGYCNRYTYDERNNILSYEGIHYDIPCFKRVDTYMYAYSEDGRILEETTFYEEIPLLDTDEEIRNFIKVIHRVNEYDNYNNLTEILRYDLYLPIGSEKTKVKIKDNKIPNIERQFKNIYNDKGELIQVLNGDTMELMSELSYISGKLDTKVLFDQGRETDIIKYIYSDDCLVKEEYYSKSGVLMKIIEHVNIRGRMCQRVLSPANDNLRWYFSDFYDTGCELVMKEEFLTMEVLVSIYDYIKSQNISKDYFYIYYYNTHELNTGTYREETDQFIEKNRIEHNISLFYT